ncbi:P-loop containing nucleoside triphosphate hydrolase protein, partial [Endogone sp. FLAS-F59071]
MNGVNNAVAQAAFSERKWVWVEDKEEGFVKGYITNEDKQGEVVEVFLDNGQTRTVTSNEVQKVNPPKFDGVDDMADLTFLNEASVVHNLRLRYHSNLIYVKDIQPHSRNPTIQTYSGLFLVAVNPYRNLNIYTNTVIEQYRNRKRGEAPPHIYAVADQAYHDMLQDRENQSILITPINRYTLTTSGESGAGKTENTKKVIQYLASVASDRKSRGELEEQILQANPILEAFGNAQTIRNNNSSRFGKFIRIEFNAAGQIAGGNIEWYLLEKSRVAYQSPHERSYHVFYQLVNGGDAELQRELLLDGTTLDDYGFTKKSNKYIDGVDDAADYRELRNAMTTMRFTSKEQHDLFRIVSTVLHLGNLTVIADRDDQARLPDTSVAERICHLLGIPVADFERALLRPRIKAGRDWVPQARNREQVLYSVEALAKALYERSFGKLVERINATIDRRRGASGGFIGVLDIAGFEIFEVNSFEQLCINYTNEKLQQFFNHRMFNLEQEEYRRENIEWKQIDFGLDLQPTIDLIEKTN